MRCSWTAPGWQCEEAPAPGKKVCLHHLAYRREYMRQYRARFRQHRQEANANARTCQHCQTKKGPDEFYRPRLKVWVAYKEFYWIICKACMREKISQARREPANGRVCHG